MSNKNPHDGDRLSWLLNVTPREKDQETDQFLAEKTRQAAARADEIEQRNDKRYTYANIFVGIALGWLIFVGLIVLLSGLDIIPLSLSDTAIVTLLGTATVNILAPAILLAKYLFNNQS